MTDAKPTRTIELVRPPSRDGVGVLRITVGDVTHFYTFHELPCEIGGRGFAVHRLGLGNLYHVRIGSLADTSCECLGYLRWGRCKHILGLAALARVGKL